MTAKLTASLQLKGPLRVDIIDVPVTNAFALPGGRIFLFKPIIERASSPMRWRGCSPTRLACGEARFDARSAA